MTLQMGPLGSSEIFGLEGLLWGVGDSGCQMSVLVGIYLLLPVPKSLLLLDVHKGHLRETGLLWIVNRDRVLPQKFPWPHAMTSAEHNKTVTPWFLSGPS